jgi:hypothetical protein
LSHFLPKFFHSHLLEDLPLWLLVDIEQHGLPNEHGRQAFVEPYTLQVVHQATLAVLVEVDPQEIGRLLVVHIWVFSEVVLVELGLALHHVGEVDLVEVGVGVRAVAEGAGVVAGTKEDDVAGGAGVK